MNHRTVMLAVTAAAAAALTLPADAAPPKPISKDFTYMDVTADPSASAVSGAGCDGHLPNEEGLEFTVPAKGKLKVTMETLGDWALEVRDAKGRMLGSSDGGMPQDQEAVSLKLKAGGTYTILPCNLGGAPEAKGKIQYTP